MSQLDFVQFTQNMRKIPGTAKISRIFIENHTSFLVPNFTSNARLTFKTPSCREGTVHITKKLISQISHTFMYCNSWITEIHN